MTSANTCNDVVSRPTFSAQWLHYKADIVSQVNKDSGTEMIHYNMDIVSQSN
jgi:hypothetical protein